MRISNDYASSILLCAEDNSSILGFDDEEDLGINGKAQGSSPDKLFEQKSVFFVDSFMGFPLQSEECFIVLLEKESEHLLARDYVNRLMSGALDITVRNDAIDWIRRVHTYYSFGPVSAYLSVSYLDRFLSKYELQKGNTWMTQLLAVACLSLASKMEETDVPLSLDLQICNAKYIFEAKTIQRMELLVLSTLNWRMQSVTPFSFIDYFLQKFNCCSSPRESQIRHCVDLILSTFRGIDLLEFRPSEVAAAVALSALESEMVAMDWALNYCAYLEKDNIMRCYEAIEHMREIKRKNSPSVGSVPQSPIGVLEAKCLSYGSDEATASSQENLENNSPAAKKRKLNSPSVL